MVTLTDISTTWGVGEGSHSLTPVVTSSQFVLIFANIVFFL